MRKFIYISLGGFAGAILRYALQSVKLQGLNSTIPLATLFINISGSFFLGFLLTAASLNWSIDEEIKLGLSVGFLGAYTTFSTFCGESVSLLRNGLYVNALSYLVMSPLLGLVAVWAGASLARKAGMIPLFFGKRWGGR